VTNGAPLLALDAMSKRYGDVQALTRASLAVRPGTVHALLGENGAGKTTLMRIAFGLARADSGAMRWAGGPVSFLSPRDALAAGLAMVQQHFSLVPSLTVAENVALGGHGLFRAEQARQRVRDLVEATGLTVDPDAPAGTLGIGAQQRVEIIKALAHGARLLILDEPTATLAPVDAASLLEWARRFASGDRAVVLITHKLRDALDVADDVTVLRAGRVVLSTAAAATTERSLAAAMLGETGDVARPGVSSGANSTSGAIVAELRDVSSEPGHTVPSLHGVTFTAQGGEIVGVAAVEGNGEDALLRILAGRERAAAGDVRLPGRVAYIPEDRHADALADDLTLTENVALGGAGARRGWIDWPAMRAHTETLMTRFDVRASSALAAARTLSGGNQQRLVLARELEGDPQLVIADQPTRGLDLRATAEVHERLRDARARGAAVVLHSADLDEVLALSDRVVVVVGGRVHEAHGGRDAIGRQMLGLSS